MPKKEGKQRQLINTVGSTGDNRGEFDDEKINDQVITPSVCVENDIHENNMDGCVSEIITPPCKQNIKLKLKVDELIFGSRSDHEQIPIYSIDFLQKWNLDIFKEYRIGGLISQLHPSAWLSEMRFENDAYLKSYLLEGIMQGFKIVDNSANIDRYLVENYSSATRDSTWSKVNDTICQEIVSSKYKLVDVIPHCVHALGVVHQNNKMRIITDCSRPAERSINNYMNETCQAFHYKTVYEVAALMEPNLFIATIDVASAYRSVPIYPGHWTYQGVSWKFDRIHSKFLVDTRLCFGLRCAPFIFTQISNFIVKCMKRRGVHRIINYLDDFIIFGQNQQECIEFQSLLFRLLINLGFQVSWKKCSAPMKINEYLGIIFDTEKMELRIPEAKMTKLFNELLFFKGKIRCTKRQLQKLCGVIAYMGKIVRGGRTFSRRFISKLKGLPDGNPRIKLSKEFILDLDWWWHFACLFNGKSLRPLKGKDTIITMSTDASLKGYGLVIGSDWQGGYFSSSMVPKLCHSLDTSHNHWVNFELQKYIQTEININFLELIPVYLGLCRITENYRNVCIVCYSDNTQTCAMVTSGVSSNASCMQILREIFWVCAMANCYIVMHHIPGSDNTIPDGISRMSLDCDSLYKFLCCSAP